MKAKNLHVAGRLSAVTLTVAVFYALWVMRPGLRIVGVSFPRQAWIMENPLLWSLGLWLWLAVIVGWVGVLISLMGAYASLGRVSTMLQFGLLLTAAALAFAGFAVWMAALPAALRLPSVNELLTLVDGLALGLLGVAALLGGVATSWVALDLMRSSPLQKRWVTIAVLAGALMVPSPFLLPFPWHLLAAAICWLVWTLYLGARRCVSAADPETR
ncbi:MAG: hypothetical protein NZ553_19835 [Caldilinea sp.]|nr:hypothetical protein [Caldilinea sp.]MDW8442735.1 hypothetical protein [Caldilineaceae bacterium]